MANQQLIGLDLGGTYIKAAVVGLDGQVRSEVSIETQAEQGPNRVIERLCLAAQQSCRAAKSELSDMLGIGLGSPGPLNEDQSVVIKSANLPGWENVALRDRLSDLTGLAVAMTNDASAATFGEFWAGAGRGARHMCMLTLGTGVGGGVIVDGQLLHGHFGNAGEFGHMIVAPDGIQCRCGQIGCLETVASSSYLIEKAVAEAKQGHSAPLTEILDSAGRIDVPDIVACARNGDRASKLLWDAACGAIATACVNLHHAFNPQYIILGGGMAAAGAFLLDTVRREFAALTWQLVEDRPELRLASLGSNAGAIGAAGWFLHLRDRDAS